MGGSRSPRSSDPFEGNSGRHGWPARSLDDNDRDRGRGRGRDRDDDRSNSSHNLNNRASPQGSGSPLASHRRESFGRSNTMGDVSVSVFHYISSVCFFRHIHAFITLHCK